MVNLDERINKKEVPIFLIIGAQKSGTSALHSYLSQHPSICSATTKELHFFNSDMNYSKGLDFYYSKFPLDNNESLFIDASPSYLHNKMAYKRIYKYNPKIKMIVLLRNPVERAYSAWNMYKNRYLKDRNWFLDGWVKYIGRSPEEYIQRCDEEIFDFKLFVSNEIKYLSSMPNKDVEASILSQGIYEEHLLKFFTLFPKEQLLVLESTSLRDNTLMMLKKIESFLSIKEFEWGKINLSPVFEGSYINKPVQSYFSELSSFYEPHNEALFKLLGTRFNWN